jgi:hypothetical protein
VLITTRPGDALGGALDAAPGGATGAGSGLMLGEAAVVASAGATRDAGTITGSYP